jgi:hypothetical protein
MNTRNFKGSRSGTIRMISLNDRMRKLCVFRLLTSGVLSKNCVKRLAGDSRRLRDLAFR